MSRKTVRTEDDASNAEEREHEDINDVESRLREVLSGTSVIPESRFVTRLKRKINKDTLHESLDCQECRNVLWRQEYRQSAHLEKKKETIRWIMYMLIGLCTGIITAIMYVIFWHVTNFQRSLIFSMVEKHEIPVAAGVVICHVIFAIIGAIFVVVEPAIIGSGIAKVIRYLNGVFYFKAFNFKTMVFKGIGCIFSEMSGIPLDVDSAMVHIGACIAACIWNCQYIKFFKNSKVLKFFHNDFEKRNFILVGAASGIASGFSAPIGGVLFGLETTANLWNQDNAWKTLCASAMCIFIVDLILFHSIVISTIVERFAFKDLKHLFYNISELPIFLVIGIIGGLFGAAFSALNTRLNIFRRQHITKWQIKILEVAIFTGIFNILQWILIHYFVFCRPVAKTNRKYVKIFCKAHEYNTMATFFWMRLHERFTWLLVAPPGEFPKNILCIYGTFLSVSVNFANGIYAALGLIYPVIVIGAIFGRLLGEVMAVYFSEKLPGKYALIGSAACLGGIVRRPLSFSIIMLEGNGLTTPYILPIIVTVTTATLVANVFKQELLDIVGTALVLPEDPPLQLLRKKAGDIMAIPVICFKLKEDAQYICDVLTNCDHNGFPVVEDVEDGDRSNGRLTGLILRSQLLVILTNGYFEERRNFWKDKITIDSFRNFKENYPTANLLRVNFRNREYTVDFSLFMNPTPTRVNMVKSAASIFRIFRGVTLRHLVVVDDANRVAGIITRKDLLSAD